MTTKIRDTPVIKIHRTQKSSSAGSLPHQAFHLMAKKTTQPSVILVGDPHRSGEISKQLAQTGVRVKKAKYLKNIDQMSDGEELGIIYVHPLKRGDIVTSHKRLRSKRRFKNTSFFAVVPGWADDRSERQLYAEGIQMVFEWPREKQKFSELFYCAVFSGLDKVRSQDLDKSLEKAVGNRLTGVYGYFAPEVDIDVYRGVVMLDGQVPNPEASRRLVRVVKQTPGVKGVVDASLEVQTP